MKPAVRALLVLLLPCKLLIADPLICNSTPKRALLQVPPKTVQQQHSLLQLRVQSNTTRQFSPRARRAVWVRAAFPRSGSSTTLSLVEAAISPERRAAGALFALFEPCHGADNVSAKLESKGCPAFLEDILNCRFEDVTRLWGWDNERSVHVGAVSFAPVHAGLSCKRAELTAFKTAGVNGRGNLELLQEYEGLHTVDVVRDPRGIAASCARTPGMLQQNVTEICHEYARVLTLKHTRLHRLVFEDLIRQPETEMKRIYRSLGLEFGPAQHQWLAKTFNAKHCDNWYYGDCRTDSQSHIEDWRLSLSEKEQDAFTADPNCQRAAAAYGWPKV